MTKPRLIICQGLPASGKTTWAKEQLQLNPNWLRANRDDIRASLFGTTTEPRGRFNRRNEGITREVRDQIIIDGLAAGRTVISDDTNLVPSTLQGLKNLAEKFDAVVEIRTFFDVSLHECITRDEKRQYPVGASVIRNMWMKYVKPTIKHNSDWIIKDFAVICDLDGTLAQLNGRDPFDASTCEQDGFNCAVGKVLDYCREDDRHVVFVSGRQEKDREPTRRWLNKMGFGDCPLFMRATDDTRNDAIVKEEIYHKFIEPTWDVVLVLDDRSKVIDMWRGLGLECWQVNYGDF